MKNMRIWIRKQESDKELVHPEGYSYQYLFGVKKIQFFQLSYPKEERLLQNSLLRIQMKHSLLGKYH